MHKTNKVARSAKGDRDDIKLDLMIFGTTRHLTGHHPHISLFVGICKLARAQLPKTDQGFKLQATADKLRVAQKRLLEKGEWSDTRGGEEPRGRKDRQDRPTRS